jgi:uncharacterized protein YjbI with pentapeptide repeats
MLNSQSKIQLSHCNFSGAKFQTLNFLKLPDNTSSFIMDNCNFSSVSDVSSLSCDNANEVQITNCDFSGASKVLLHFSDCVAKEIILSGNNFGTCSSTTSHSFYFDADAEVEFCNNIINANNFYLFQLFSHTPKRINIAGTYIKNTDSLDSMFYNNTIIEEVDLSELKTDEIKTLDLLFNGCTALKKVKLNNGKMNDITDWDGIFQGCSSLTEVDLRGVIINGSASNNRAFYGCTALHTIRADDWNYYSIKMLIESSGFPTGSTTDYRTRLIYCKESEAQGLTAPSGWRFSYV